jgi:4a-hydroxytetrahydrobiopterin dehydratase
MPILTPAEITLALTTLNGWKLKDGAIARQFTFVDFGEAMSFVNAVAALAERAGHHPDIDIRYNQVKLALISHDQGGLTEQDMNMAQTIDSIS